MNTISAFIIYLTIFRLSIIAAGVISIAFGYRLFCKGILTEKGATVNAEVGTSKFALKNAAPGTCFALFGVIIISSMLIAGSPEMTMKLINSTPQIDQKNVNDDVKSEMSVQMRGSDGRLLAAFEKGKFYLSQNKKPEAISEYQKAVNLIANPINNLAWLYYDQGEIDKALPLAQVAVQLSPDNANAFETLADILFKKKEVTNAVQILEKAAAINPKKFSKKLEQFKKAASQM
ncbi:Tetratricopeptide repeat protein [Candidatus Magnetomoraceae bacterium gMMP-13]